MTGMTALSIWFWQRLVTPHMALLASEMAARGHDVTYVAEQPLNAERTALGWEEFDLPGVSVHFATTASEAEALVANSEDHTVHLTQGLRANGNVAAAQNAIRARGQCHFVVMETVDRRGASRFLKAPLYAWHLFRWRRGLHGVLAIGADTPDWLRRLAPVRLRIFPFAYFLQAPKPLLVDSPDAPFGFLFVGALCWRKRIDLLLRGLGELSRQNFHVDIVGDGPLRTDLEALAARVLPGRVTFHGVLPISHIPAYMSSADCLILPSEHDGWGAVISEALMAGTPVICSAACGARAVVQASGTGGVFPTNDTPALRQLLDTALAKGKIGNDDRAHLRSWARCLGAAAGATYLEAILAAKQVSAARAPSPPWHPEAER